MQTTNMPVLFTGHGSPMNAIGTNRARTGWQKMGQALPKPRVIIAVSAHWATQGILVRDSAVNPQINDMYGFPEALYRIHYEPAGAPAYAKRILALEPRAVVNNDWGIDHGVWTVLANMFPGADIPVVMVSTDISAGPASMYNLGQHLAPLRAEGALIVASGNVVHSLRDVGWDMENGYPWADSFDKAIQDAILAGDFQTPVNFARLAGAARAVPTPEHYYPLLAALGAASPADKVTVWNNYRELGSMSMTSYLFTDQA